MRARGMFTAVALASGLLVGAPAESMATSNPFATDFNVADMDQFTWGDPSGPFNEMGYVALFIPGQFRLLGQSFTVGTNGYMYGFDVVLDGAALPGRDTVAWALLPGDLPLGPTSPIQSGTFSIDSSWSPGYFSIDIADIPVTVGQAFTLVLADLTATQQGASQSVTWAYGDANVPNWAPYSGGGSAFFSYNSGNNTFHRLGGLEVDFHLASYVAQGAVPEPASIGVVLAGAGALLARGAMSRRSV